MISSKSAPALCYASSLGALSSWPAVIASPGRSRDRRTGPSGWPSRRHLTSLRDAPSPGPKAGDERWPTALNPTPYDIFGHPKDAPYSKHRFYELVKLYHPDRHSHTAHDGIPQHTKLERYRLVVAANSLLSDPYRRRMYDRHGTGWEGCVAEDLRSVDRVWRNRSGNASMNATWEDWERWYQEQDGKKQEPLYVSNGTFVVIIAALAFVGGWGHITRAGTKAHSLMDIREEHHAAVSQGMRQRQSLNAGMSKEERVRYFLQQREG